MSYIHGYDSDTLREIVDLDDCRARLSEIGDQRSLASLLERVWLLKVLDRADEALAVSDETVRLARMGGTRKDLLRARILHATVQQRRGAYAAADHELTRCIEEADGQRWTAIAAFAYQHRGKVRLDAGDFDGARRDFKHTLFLRQEMGASEDELAATLIAVDTADRRRAQASVAS